MEPVRKQDGPTTGLPGKKLAFKRYVATTETGLHTKLAQQHGEALAQALIDGDPEIDRELVGREVGDTQTVFLSGGGEVLHASPSLVEVIFGTDGKERERKPAEDVPSNTNDEAPIRWTKMRLKRGEVVGKFAFCRTIQLKPTPICTRAPRRSPRLRSGSIATVSNACAASSSRCARRRP